MTAAPNTSAGEPASPAPPARFAHFVDILARHRRFLVRWLAAATALSAIVAFLLPVQFKSVTSVFPAEEADLFGGLEGVASLAKSFSPKSIAGLGRDPELDRYLAILKSGRVLSAVINKFDLVKVYGFTSYPFEKATKELLANVEFTIEEENYLSVTVYDEDARRAAEMAEFFVEELNKVNTELRVTNARGNRTFIEERYKKNIDDLRTAEDSLKSFQKRYGVVAMPQQAEEAIKAGAEMTASLAMKEVELDVLRRTQSADHPMVTSARIEVEELRRKLQQMGSTGVGSAGDVKLMVPFRDIPELGSEYLRRFRDVEIQYKILQFLTPLFEQAKVEERKNTPSVIILDHAMPAERKSRPKRLVIILGGLFVGLVTGLLSIALTERWKTEQARDSEAYRSLSSLAAALREDLRVLFRKRTRRP